MAIANSIRNDPNNTIKYITVPTPKSLDELDAWPAKVRAAIPQGVLAADLCVDDWDEIGIEVFRPKTEEELEEQRLYDIEQETWELEELARLKAKYEPETAVGA